MTERTTFVLGAGGLAREMAELIDEARRNDPALGLLFGGFIGGPDDVVGRDLGRGPVMGDDDWLADWTGPRNLVVGVGTPSIRVSLTRKHITDPRNVFPTLIHPRTTIGRNVAFGHGNCITAGCTFTCDISVGAFNLFNLNTTVGHDAIVGSFNVINPGTNISGGVRIGDRVLIGTGAQILENLNIGDDVVVGAGAVVTKDVDPGQIVVGVPARPLKA